MGSVMANNMPVNPAIFQKQYFDNIISINGDNGPKQILKDNIKDCYVYHVDSNMLLDIDTFDDIKNDKY